MEFIYTAFAAAFAIVFLSLWVFNLGESARYKRANVRLREIHAQNLADLRSHLVERLKLRDSKLPDADRDVYARIVDLYDEPEMMEFPQRIQYARRYRADEYERPGEDYEVYFWVVDIDELEDDELFVYWYEGIINGTA